MATATRMTLTSRTDFLLLYKETAEKSIQIVVLTDSGPRMLRIFGDANSPRNKGVPLLTVKGRLIMQRLR